MLREAMLLHTTTSMQITVQQVHFRIRSINSSHHLRRSFGERAHLLDTHT